VQQSRRCDGRGMVTCPCNRPASLSQSTLGHWHIVTTSLRLRPPSSPPRVVPLHSLASPLSFLSVASMLSTTRSAASMALRGASPPRKSCLCPGANKMYSQTRHGAAAIPRRKRSFPVLELLGQGDHNEVTRHNPRQPWHTTADEDGATGGAIAEPGGQEGCYAICAVCHAYV
jgi:hypothetical protein